MEIQENPKKSHDILRKIKENQENPRNSKKIQEKTMIFQGNKEKLRKSEGNQYKCMENDAFFTPRHSWPPAPTGPSAQNRCV